MEAGFDCVEVHVGHNYLLSSFLSPNLNRRTETYGVSVEGRSRFPREVLSAVREAVGDRAADRREPPGGAAAASDGAVDALQLTGGSSLLTEALFLDDARHFLAALDLPIVLLGGVNRLDTMEAVEGSCTHGVLR